MHGQTPIGSIREGIEWAALGIELLGAVGIVAGALRVVSTHAARCASR